MKIKFITATALIIAGSFAAPAMAADCQVASKAQPSKSFTSMAQAPRKFKSSPVQKRLRAGFNRSMASKGKDPAAAADHPLDDVEFMCDDWIAICADDDCNHGVVECDGVCAPF